MMRLYVVEGTAEEISRIVNTMQPTMGANTMSVEAPAKEVSSQTMPPKEISPGSKYVTLPCARRVLARRPLLSAPLKAMLLALYEAHPEWVPSADLYAATGYSFRQFAGLMGAFGRRKYNTKGFESEREAKFFEIRRSEDDGSWEYRLPETVREALRQENLVPEDEAGES